MGAGPMTLPEMLAQQQAALATHQAAMAQLADAS